MRSLAVAFVAAAITPGHSCEQLLVGLFAGAEFRNRCRRFPPAEFHHCSTAARDDEQARPRDAVVERIIVEAEELIASGIFGNDATDTFWLRHDLLGVIGCVRLEDLTDDTPMFDLRLAAEFRGQGLGPECLRAVTDHVFMSMNVDRFEGQTRDDNVAMRSTFIRAGWTKEAHHRRGWPVSGQEPRDTVAYAILREEWRSGTSMQVHWHDRPTFSPETQTGVVYTSNRMPRADELLEHYEALGFCEVSDSGPTEAHAFVKL